MAKKHTKKEAVSIVISAARLYRDNLAGKRLLFLMTDKHKNVFDLEVGFDASNFQHLTGLQSTNKNWSRLDFYVFCMTFLYKIAKTFCRSLQLHFVGNCKPG